MTRVLFIGTALTGIAFSATNFSHAVDQARVLDIAWAIAVATALWSLPLVIAVLAWWAPLGWLRGTAIAYIVIYSAAVLTWPIAQQVPRLPDGIQPWVINLLPMAIFAGALVLPEMGAWIFLGTMCIAAGVLRFVADGGMNIAVPVQDTLFNTMYVAVFVAIILVTLRAGRHRDETAMKTAEDAVLAAAAEAQNLERATVAALTHDDVISTLMAAARATDASAPLVPKYATRALERLDALSATDTDPAGVSPAHALVSTLRETVTALAENVTFSAPGTVDVEVPNAAIRALADATAEAVRNSVRHAGDSGVTRVVSVVVASTGATVEIVDDGPGFSPVGLPTDRFGIRFSIMHRMELLPGGSAVIDATPGLGTRIVLRWERPSS